LHEPFHVASNMMNILFLSTWFPYPPDNGSKLRAYYLIRALARRHQVTVIAFRPESTSAEAPANPLEPVPAPVWGVPDDPYRYVNLPQIVKYLSPIPLAAWSSRRMRRTVRHVALKTRWDAVVAFRTPVARYALLPDSTARVFDIDNSFSFVGRERLAAQTTALARLKAYASCYKSFRYESRLARHFDACTVVSPSEVHLILKMVSGTSCRVAVNENGVDCTHNRPGLAQPRPGALVYNGSLTYNANYDAMRWFLAECYPRIRAQQPEVTLTITGSTKGVNLGGLALDDSVRLTGYVDDVRPSVAGAAACIVPIRHGGGTRLKILEAMALGTPVVSTCKGAEGLDVVDGEHLLLADGPERFARQTITLLREPDLRERLAANARRLVSARYDWEQLGRQFVALVEEAAAVQQMRPV
jgi:glycosyltransferase involved in cell wall biosynthesis